LVVGVHSDEEITKHKGPPVMTEEERYLAVAACKWVDEVVPGAPYVTQLEYMDKYNCDYCVHGDDLVMTADGEDTYHLVKKAGRFRTIPRTVGVSTTDLVGRMLLMTREHHSPYTSDRNANTFASNASILELSEGKNKQSPYTALSKFMPTTRRIVQFSEGRDPTPDDVVVYIDGAFDLFHIGHIEILRKAREHGTYLLVGVHSDQVVSQRKGNGHPIMNLHERVLSVLSCRYVDEVLIGAPWEPTEEMIRQHRIEVVVHGTIADPGFISGPDPYSVPKKMGIYKNIESPRKLTTSDVVQRIIENRKKFEDRNKKKEAKELAMLEAIEKGETQVV
jgi:ethanolamine-phosphate cytidylyltransferase